MSDIQHLVAQEELGEETKAFLKTNVGRYIDGCSQQDIDEAKDALLELNVHEFQTLEALQSKVSEIQNRAKVASAIRGYLAEAIIKGDQATHQLSEEGND